MDPFDIHQSSIWRCPHAFIDRSGRPILIKFLDEALREKFVAMYMAYRPRNSFNGLPPIQDAACSAWARHMVESGLNLVAISFEDGLIGHTGIFRMNQDMCELFAAVTAPYQRVGIGTQLTRCAIQLAYEAGFDRIWLSVESRNHIARHVYAKCGFKYGDTDDITELEMTFDLSLYHDAMDAPISEVMNPCTISIRQDSSCKAALETFLRAHIASLPVVDSENRVVGIMSETDMMTPASLFQRVTDVFTRNVVTVHGDSPISKIIRLFSSKGLRYVPVVDENDRLIGVVGRRDILAYYDKAVGSRTD